MEFSINPQILVNALRDHFSLEDLRGLAFSLNINFDDIAGDTSYEKARSLVKYLESRGQLEKLLEQISLSRPQLDLSSQTNTKLKEGQGLLKIYSNRSGSVNEINMFLQDLESAYNSLYYFDKVFLKNFNRQNLYLAPFYYSVNHMYSAIGREQKKEYVLPNDRLLINRIRIESPGFWEFMGALNPLQQIREFLNDRHRRRQDREYRESAEEEKLNLDNQLLQSQIQGQNIANIQEGIKIMRDLGFTDEQIQIIILNNIGIPLFELGKHQDTALIDVTD